MAGAQVGEHGGGQELVKADDLELRGARLGLAVAARVDDQAGLGLLEERDVVRQVEGAGQRDRDGLGRQAGRGPLGTAALVLDHPPVALGAQRPRADEDRVGLRAQQVEELAIGRVAERRGDAAERRAPVGAADHVDGEDLAAGEPGHRLGALEISALPHRPRPGHRRAADPASHLHAVLPAPESLD